MARHWRAHLRPLALEVGVFLVAWLVWFAVGMAAMTWLVASLLLSQWAETAFWSVALPFVSLMSMAAALACVFFVFCVQRRQP
jgi:hypothetical protein